MSRLLKEFLSNWYPTLILTVLLLTSLRLTAAQASNFTTDTQTALIFGTHEITFTGNGSVDNPFATEATVTFIPSSGSANAKTVDMFYDGGDTWRARTYINEVGQWSWVSQSGDDPGLDGNSGSFTASASDLRGILRPHPTNPTQWATENGQGFLNINDTAYRLFDSAETYWQDYIRDNATMGITSVRSGGLGGWSWGSEMEANNYPWDENDLTRFDLAKFQTTDTRLQWMLDNYPNMYVQMILFGNISFQTDEVGMAWKNLPPDVRTNTMRYMIARWAAYPQLFWLVVNDMPCDVSFPNNRAFAREVGNYFAVHDPWNHLLSSGPARNMPFCFTDPEDAEWVSYIHLEGAYELGAEWIRDYASMNVHVFLGEDYYEQDHPAGFPSHPEYFQRWLFWSWLLAGGSANYGGRYPVIHPYSRTDQLPFSFNNRNWGRLEGLDSVPYIASYFQDRNIDLTYFQSDDNLVRDLDDRNDFRRPKLTRRAFDEFIVYHPNAKTAGRLAEVDHALTVRLSLDLSQVDGLFSVEWYRPADGVSEVGGQVQGGEMMEFTAPWQGYDVVLRLVREGSGRVPMETTATITATPSDVTSASRISVGLQVLYSFDEGSGNVIHDSSGVEAPLDLLIEDVSAISWTDGGLSVNSPTLISSENAATRIIHSIRTSNAITIEAWIRPANTNQNGPARIISLSRDISNRYFTLGQGRGDDEPSTLYDVRLRTSLTDENGVPSLTTPEDVVLSELSHIVYTRDMSGNTRIYVDGIEVVTGTVNGDMSNWEADDLRLALANEFSLDRPWLGEYRLVAIYNRALSSTEIAQNWAMGSEGEF
jgi:hypothetical protein